MKGYELAVVVCGVIQAETILAHRKLVFEQSGEVLPSPEAIQMNHPHLLSVGLVAECAYAGSIIAQAYMNEGKSHLQVVLKQSANKSTVIVESFDAHRYSERLANTKDKAMHNVDHGLIRYGFVRADDAECDVLRQPACILDKHRNILAWFLPHILLPQRQVSRLVPGGAEIHLLSPLSRRK